MKRNEEEKKSSSIQKLKDQKINSHQPVEGPVICQHFHYLM